MVCMIPGEGLLCVEKEGGVGGVLIVTYREAYVR
jgi:hypothetical protein